MWLEGVDYLNSIRLEEAGDVPVLLVDREVVCCAAAVIPQLGVHSALNEQLRTLHIALCACADRWLSIL